MNAELFQYCLSQPGVITIPIEALSDQGLNKQWQIELSHHPVFSQQAVELFSKAYALYWQRAKWLYKTAPQYWFPPRAQHICIVTDPDLIRPYFQPFNKNSWLLYSSDFNPETSNIEFAAYQFVHVERMWLLQQIDPVLYFNFSYFLNLNNDQVQGFTDGCQQTTRPDGDGFRTLARVMPDIRQLYHQSLKKPQTRLSNVRVMQDTGLIISAAIFPPLNQLQQTWSQTAQCTITRHQESHDVKARQAGNKLCQWLIDKQPHLLITGDIDGDPNGVLWSPDSANKSDRLKAVITQASESAELCILEDLKTIDYHSQRFLNSLRQPEQLTDPPSYMTEGGLSYIHKDYKLVAYNLSQDKNQARLWQPTPPYERFMLAARTVHEWGHLAAESGWVVVPEEFQAKRQQLEQSLAALFDQIHSRTPIKIQTQIAPEVARLQAETGSLGQTLLKRMLVRIEDYMANLVAVRFLSPDEMDTYVRNNVHCHLQNYSSEGIYMQLIRLAYEFQYLSLSRIENPLEWFYSSTWFVEYFVDNGIISKALFEQLTGVVGEICDCYSVAESKFDFGMLSSRQ